MRKLLLPRKHSERDWKKIKPKQCMHSLSEEILAQKFIVNIKIKCIAYYMNGYVWVVVNSMHLAQTGGISYSPYEEGNTSLRVCIIIF